MNPRATWNLLTLVVSASFALSNWVGAQSLEIVSGVTTNMTGTNCSILGQPYTETMLTGTASYLRYTDLSAPLTGDGTYVDVLMTVPGLNCNPDSSVGFVPSLVLPPGASLNITAQTPVKCFYKINNQAFTPFTGTQIGVISTQGTGLRVGPICPDGQGGGVGTPFQIGPSGTYGGIALGLQYFPRSSWLEIQVPVRFSKELLGAAGPNGGDKVQFIFDTAGLSPDPAYASTWINVPYRALLAAPSAGAPSGTGVTVSTTLYSYFQGGLLSVDYGTTASFGLTSASSTISGNNESQPASIALSGLNPGTSYSYRFKYVTSKGTFYSSTGTFSTGAAQNFALGVTKNGAGSGTVSSAPAGINCGAACSANFTSGTNVALTAVPASGSSFAGWGGACSGAGACNVTMNAAQSVTASFNTVPQVGSLSLEVTGLPSGSSAALGIAGPGGFNTTRTILTGTGQNLSDVTVGTYTVTAPNVTVGSSVYAPNAASQTANVSFGATVTVGVVYTLSSTPTFPLSVTKAGTGTGAVSSNPAGIDCGASCTANFNQNATVTLTATPAAGSSFASWGGACSGSVTTCTLTMSAAKSVTATFNTVPVGGTNVALTVTKSGTGTGGVSSNPGGINCGATCTANFAQGSSVSLTATPDAASTFAGWSGACSGTGACSVTMSGAKSVTATFTASGVTPPPPPAGATASASKSSNTPSTATAIKGSSNNAALGVDLSLGSSAGTLQSVSLSASGTGNDQLDITGVRLYLDANSNGAVDAGETALAQGTFNANDGAATLTLTAPKALTANSTSRLLVTLDLNSSIAGMPLKAALGSAALALLLGWRSRRRLVIVALMGLAATLTACPVTVTPVGTTRTYQVTITAVSLKDSSNATIPVSGLPISGATISVTK